MNCKCADHYENLMIFGYCYHCRHILALGIQEEQDEIAERMKADFVRSGIEIALSVNK